MGIKIAGLGKAVPDNKITNQEISEIVDTSDDWIRSRTGIESRHIAIYETTESLAVEAAKEAIENAGKQAVDIDLIIVATVSPDTTMPSTACKVAKEIGAYHALCFDVTAACSGFIIATEVARKMMASGEYHHALIIGAEVLSKVVDWEDRGTCVLFADGAGAAVMVSTDKDQIIQSDVGTDPLGADKITLPAGVGNHKFYQAKSNNQTISMVGRDVYTFATTKVPWSILRVLDKEGLEASDINWYILHQANSRIMDAVAKKLGVESTRFFKNLNEYGNTSAASIPIALYEASAKFKPGDLIIVSGFGAGLTWGTLLIKW